MAKRVHGQPTCELRITIFVYFQELNLAERVGFEPTCRLPDKTLSRRPRYDHFGTSPVVRRQSMGQFKDPQPLLPAAGRSEDRPLHTVHITGVTRTSDYTSLLRRVKLRGD